MSEPEIQHDATEDAQELQLYLILPDDCSSAQLSTALEAAPIACLLLPRALAEKEAAARVLIALGQGAGAACLVADDAALAKRLEADGVHASQPLEVAALRRELGEDAVLGAFCATSRHAAMEAGEAGADYVAFASDVPASEAAGQQNEDEDEETPSGSEEILAWWQALMTLPCVAWDITDEDNALALADAGADVLALSPAWLADPEGLTKLVERLSAG